jgi:hypothetical protein
MLGSIAGLAGGLMGGGGGSAPSAARGSQDGNALSSGGNSDFNVGGPAGNLWLFITLAAIGGWLLGRHTK